MNLMFNMIVYNIMYSFSFLYIKCHIIKKISFILVEYISHFKSLKLFVFLNGTQNSIVKIETFQPYLMIKTHFKLYLYLRRRRIR